MMIYQIFGFNFNYEQYIEELSMYLFDNNNISMPEITISIVDKLNVDTSVGIEIINEVGYSNHSKAGSYYCFKDELSMFITQKEIVFCGEKINTKKIGAEIGGAASIILSRLNNRAVLHGSAFLYHGKAYLLCAYPGAGKSTLSVAMSKYHNCVTFLTDDIICIENNGISIYSGMHNVSLNSDSYKELFLELDERCEVATSKRNSNSKVKCNLGKKDDSVGQQVEIGGIFFLNTPIEDSLVKIEKLNKIDVFYEAMKNIKYKKSLISEFLIQEMRIVNNMVNNNIFGVKLQIKHDYSELQEITNIIIDYIDKWE